MKRLLIIAVAAALLIGCKTVPIQNRSPIHVPSGLNENQVEAAILLTIGNHDANESNLSGWQMIADNALQARFQHYTSTEYSGFERYWYFEERKPKTIFVGFRKSELYMRVAVHFDTNEVKTDIVDSKNFRQTDKEIHKKAYMYLDDFEYRLQRSLGDVARMVSYDAPQTGKGNTPPIIKPMAK